MRLLYGRLNRIIDLVTKLTMRVHNIQHESTHYIINISTLQ